jgi:hypothetical protein
MVEDVRPGFAGEVQGLIDVFGWREFREGILAGQKFPIDEHPFPIFDANVGKIGFLPSPLAGDVAGFYSFAKGIVQDILMIYKGEFTGRVPEMVFRRNLVSGKVITITGLKPGQRSLYILKNPGSPWPTK